MASTYTDLGLELMATGENAGTWGTKTNANLSLIEQLTGGVNSQAVTDSGTPTALTIADGALTGTAQQRVIELTGSISGSRVVTFPLLTENFYFIKNSTSGAQTVQLKAVSGSGATVTFATGNKGWKVIYLDGVATNTGVFEIEIDTTATPAGSDTQVQFNNSGTFGGSENLAWDGTNLQIGDQGDLRLGDADNSNYIALQATATVASNVTNYAVTVASGTNSYGTGNKYYINGSVSPTLTLNEGSTYWFDQSDSSNGSHPLRFSTTANGTHGGGVPYTTGVTTTGTPGSAGAYTKITVASGAPTLYYYCTNHSGMGGQANTP